MTLLPSVTATSLACMLDSQSAESIVCGLSLHQPKATYSGLDGGQIIPYDSQNRTQPSVDILTGVWINAVVVSIVDEMWFHSLKIEKQTWIQISRLGVRGLTSSVLSTNDIMFQIIFPVLDDWSEYVVQSLDPTRTGRRKRKVAAWINIIEMWFRQSHSEWILK